VALLPAAKKTFMYECKIAEIVYKNCVVLHMYVVYIVALMVANNTSQQDFGTQKVYCVSNVTFHPESKYAIKIFPSPTVFVQWPF